MKRAGVSSIMVLICVVAFAGTLNAGESIRDFSLKTLDGKTIRSATLKGMPMVINIGSHW